MHELGITQEIVSIVAERAGERKVSRIILQIGRLSCVVPDAIRFCFELCSEGTVAEGAALEIEEIPGRGRCRQCDAAVTLNDPLAGCECGSAAIDWMSGQELRIQAMEIA